MTRSRRLVRWAWVGRRGRLDLLSVVARALAWTIVIQSAVARRRAGAAGWSSRRSRVGLFANAVLPGRVGEVGRVAVLARRMPGRKGGWGGAGRDGVRAPHARHRPGGPPGHLGRLSSGRASRAGPGDETDVRGRLRPRRCSCSRSSARAITTSWRLEGLGSGPPVLTMGTPGLGVMRAQPGRRSRASSRSSAGSCQILAVYTRDARLRHLLSPSSRPGSCC